MRAVTVTILFWVLVLGAEAQSIRVDQTGVNVNSQNQTTVFLTFGPIPFGYVPAEAIWCGELVPATLPAQGLECRPDTIYGSLPLRYDRSQFSGAGGFTDIMSIPSSVVRRAYFAAVRGADAGFFYVRRFVSTTGGPDQFVNVTCRMTGGGARVPFALTNVELKTSSPEPILFLNKGEPFPTVQAEIRYNGTGRLKGRWEIVQPGEEPTSDTDLLTEATLPIEQRSSQKRYTEIARFDDFLPPAGKFTLKLENPEIKWLNADGQYLLLLRIEAVNDKEGDSDLAGLGVGNGVVHSGAVAGFPMPTLKFFFSGDSRKLWQSRGIIGPADQFTFTAGQPMVFRWREFPNTVMYRIEFRDDAKRVFAAILPAVTTFYKLPSWFPQKFGGKILRWRVTALDEKGNEILRTEEQTVTF